MAGDVLVPVGSHFFTAQALQKALDETLPKLPDGKTIALAGALDNEGVKVAVVFQRESAEFNWTAKAAFEHEWTGDDKIGVTFGVSR